MGIVYLFMIARLPRKGKKKMKTPKAIKLPSGSWFCRIRMNGKDVGITKPTEKEAIAAAMAVKAGLVQINKTPMADRILTDAIDLWIESNNNRLSPSTIRGYRICQENGFPMLMRMKCSAITDKHIEQTVNSECRRYKAKTVVNRWRFLAQVLTWATGKHYSAKLPQVVRPDIEFLDQEDLTTFLKHIRGAPVEITALLAISSLRRSEIAALNWDDGSIDLKHRWIHVRGAVVQDENNKLVKKATTKNSTSRRDVPMIDPLFEALSAIENKTGPVVKVHPETMNNRINRACAAAGVPEVGCHGLRHSFASLCHILNIPAAVAMEIGGWADRATMDRIYTHVSKRDKNSYQNAFTAHFSTKTTLKNDNENGNDD
jgi:integrase